MMKVGFVILNYNSWELTKKLAVKLSSYQCVDEIVVVDNVSTDDSYDKLLEIRGNKIHVHQSDRNGGYSYGNNYGAQICNELGVDVMFIANPDVDIEEDELGKIVTQFDRTNYTMLSGVEYDIDDKMGDSPIWWVNSYWDDLAECFFVGRKLMKKNPPKLDTTSDVQEVDILKGSFMGVRLDEFLQIGGFDDEFFLFCEERVIAKRIKNSGGRIGVVTDVKYNHNHTASITKTYKKVHSQIELLYRSRELYLRKYENIGAIKKIIYKCSTGISLLEYRLLGFLK